LHDLVVKGDLEWEIKMSKLRFFVEKILGKFMFIVVGIFASITGSSKEASLQVYNFNAASFAKASALGELSSACDAEEFRDFLILKYNLASVSDELLNRMATIDDFEAYRKEAIIWTARTSGNPTCICD
jgi:hypothetical protein